MDWDEVALGKKTMYKIDGWLDKYKARLVAKEYVQKTCADFRESHNLTSSLKLSEKSW